MQLEDVLRIRESDEQIRQQKIKSRQDELLQQINYQLKRVSTQPSDDTNKLLDTIVSKLKERNGTIHT